MIGIDTNILIHYLTQDDIDRAQVAEHILNNYATSPNSLFINNIVFCKLTSTLEQEYKYDKEEICRLIKQMLSTKEFAFENQKLLWQALNQYTQNKIDFSTALITEINKEFNCSKSLTMDSPLVDLDIPMPAEHSL